MAERIAERFGVSASWLLFGDEEIRSLSGFEAAMERLRGAARRFVDGPRLADYEAEMERLREEGRRVAAAEGAARYARGPVWEAAAVEALGEGEVCVVELGDGRRVLRRVWMREGQILLESIGRAEPQTRVRRREIRRAWRLVGVLF